MRSPPRPTSATRPRSRPCPPRRAAPRRAGHPGQQRGDLPQTTIIGTTEHDYNRVMALNTKGPFLAMQHAGRRLRDHGRIINLSTINTALPEPGIAVYAASKAALEQLTAVAAREFGHRGITVNSVSPGATDTDLLHTRMPTEAVEQMTAVTALGRLGQPADIADGARAKSAISRTVPGSALS